MNGLNFRARGLVDAKVESGLTGHRIPKIREINVHKGQLPTGALNGSFEPVNNGHVTLRVYMDKEDTKGPFGVKRPNYGGLDFPKSKFGRFVKETMGMQPVTVDCRGGG